MANIYGIDLGTCNIKIFSKHSNKIIKEKNTIAVINKNQLYAYGDEAYAMYEKAPENINVSFPVTGGVIADYNNMQTMVQELLEKNVNVMNDIMEQITRYTREAIIIVVSNPLDILTYIAQKKFDYPANKIFGTGTLLDTARFNKMLGDLCGVDAKNVTGFVLGEHGSTSFIPWNTVNIVGVPFSEFEKQFELKEKLDKEKLLHDTKVIGLDIVELKGYTSSGVALSACRLIGSIVRNEKSVVPVSTVLSGQYGLTGAAMSLPCVISKNGIDRVLELPLDEQGKSDLQKCYEHLRTAIESVYTEA